MWAMAFKRARRLSSEGTIHHGAKRVSVFLNITSRAREYRYQRLSEGSAKNREQEREAYPHNANISELP